MSMRRRDYGSSIIHIYSGTHKSLEVEVVDPYTGGPKDMSDHNLYHHMDAKVCRTTGEVLLTPTVRFESRAGGIIQVEMRGTTDEMAGNHILTISFHNAGDEIIDRQVMGINIRRPC